MQAPFDDNTSPTPVSLLQLASKSPRRRELLDQIGVRYRVVVINVDETRDGDEGAEAYVLRLARAKARAGYDASPSSPTLGADTIVAVDNKILGKPDSAVSSAAMLRLLSGRSHRVITALAMCEGTRLEHRISCTEVHFRKLSATEIDSYWRTGEAADKAGSYGIQGFGAVFVERIHGSYSGVVGLPLQETAELCKCFGIPCWSDHVEVDVQ